MIKLIERKRIMALLVLSIILVTATVSVGVYDFGVKSGSLEIDGNKSEIKTNSNTVRELLKEKKIVLANEDKLNVLKGKKLKDGFRISIKRAIPVVLNVGNVPVEIKTAETTVEAVLSSNSIAYGEMDKIAPALETKVTPYMEIKVTRVAETMRTLEEEIPYVSESRQNPELEEGKVNLIQAGVKGAKTLEIKDLYEDNVWMSCQIISETVSREAVNEIVEIGTKKADVASRGGMVSRALTDGGNAAAPSGGGVVMRATAYDDNPANNGGYVGITALGTKLRPGVIAVDPNVIPLGTQVYIEYEDGTPYGYGIAEDTGGAIKGNKIDIFMDSSLVWEFGVRNMKVYILG